MKPHNPIEHVIIIVKENHTFDNYFGTFPGANGVTLPAASDPPPHDQTHDHAAWLNRAKGAVKLNKNQPTPPPFFPSPQLFFFSKNFSPKGGSQSEPNH